MSVYRPRGTSFWHFDFQVGGHRFHGSTKTGSRRQAEAVERTEKEKAKAVVKLAAAGPLALTVDVAFGRFWNEVGQHQANAGTVWTNLERMVAPGYLDKDMLLSDITDDVVSKLVHRRRVETIKGRPDAPRISAATVNRSIVQQLQVVFTTAKKKWGALFDREPDWGNHQLKEAEHRVRELNGDEADRIDAQVRDDYQPYFDFVRQTGQRQAECLLLWSEVNWATGQITTKGKGSRTVVIPITSVVREILWPLRRHHPEHVFTYIAARTDARKGRVKGQRYPITVDGLKTAWRRLRAKSGVVDFRFHDFRQDFGTKLLRRTGNLKLVSEALNHADVTTTARYYAHVVGDDVRSALEDVQKSRNRSRNKLREVG